MADNYDDAVDQVTLTLEDDTELLCDILAIYPCNGKKYIALAPADQAEDPDIFLYRFEGDENADEDDLALIDIESDEEFEAASDAFYEFLDTAEFEELLDEEDGE